MPFLLSTKECSKVEIGLFFSAGTKLIRPTTVHLVIFPKLCFDFRKSISGPIELKFSGKNLKS